MNPPLSYTIARELGLCAFDALATTTGGEPQRVCLPVPGEIADDKCDCGQLAVTVPRWFGSRTPPTLAFEDADSAPCGMPYLAVDVLVRIMRCAPTPDSRGNPPSCEALERAALIQHEDAMAVRRGIGCCLAEMADQDRIVGFILRATESAGPLGACVGSQVSLTFWVPSCLCPPEPGS